MPWSPSQPLTVELPGEADARWGDGGGGAVLGESLAIWPSPNFTIDRV